MAAKPWQIVQIVEGGRDPLNLGDYAAPFGRPRHSPVVTDKIAVRHAATYYPGATKPTRHTFGVRFDDWTLAGRWMDWALIARNETANSLANKVKAYVSDQLPVRITWGDVVAATGLLLSLETARESDTEIAWKLDIAIDSDDTMPTRPPPVTAVDPSDNITALQQALARVPTSQSLPRDIPFSFPNNVLDSIDTIVSMLNGFGAQLQSIADGIDSFERASSTELNRIRGIVSQMKTAALTLQATFDDATNDFAISQSTASSQAAYAEQAASARDDAIFMQALLAELDVQVQRAQVGREDKTVRAQGTESWEQLAVRHYGSVTKADALRQANMARYGRKPQAGRIIHVPRG